MESNKLKWSSLGQQTLEWKDQTQVLQLKKTTADFWAQVVRLWVWNCYRKAGLHYKTHGGKCENIVCFIRVDSAFVTVYSCKSYRCGGMEVSLAVYILLLMYSKLICIFWRNVSLYIVAVCRWSSGKFVCILQCLLLPSLSRLCQKTPCTKAGVHQLQAHEVFQRDKL